MTGRSRFSAWLWPVGAFLAVFVVGLRLHTQGFNLLDDGLWVLGTRTVADGGLLYRDLFSIYGPARYLFVLPFFLMFGKSALGLAVAKAAADGLAAAVGLWGVRRLGAGRWSWLVPVGVIALAPVQPRYVAAAALALWAAGLFREEGVLRRPLALGLAWGGLSLFGLDMAAYGGVILAVGLVFRRMARGEEPAFPRQVGLLLAGWAAVLGCAAALAVALGVLGDAWWDTVVYPVTRFSGAMGLSWWRVFADGPRLGEVFASLYTGEVLPAAWPAQATMGTLALRGLYLGAWCVPVAGLVWGLRRRRIPLGPLAGLGLAGWATLLGRGDPEHLAMIWYGCLLIAVLGVATLWRCKRAAGGVLAALLVLMLAPLLMEHLWLTVHPGRPGLGNWVRDTARVRMSSDRILDLEALLGRIPGEPDAALVAWPSQPGLIFLQGGRPATAQTTLLAGEVRDPQRVVAELERSTPAHIVQGSAAGLVPGVRTLRALAPEIYPYLRTHYAISGAFQLRPEREGFWLLDRLQPGDPSPPTLELKRQLPGAEQYVIGSFGPPIAGPRRVVQTVAVREYPLHAVTLKLAAQGPYPATVPVELTIVETLASGQGVVRATVTRDVVFDQLQQTVHFEFAPVDDSVGKVLALVLANGDLDGAPFTVSWSMPPDAQTAPVDYYPEGICLVDGTAVQADLYFVIY